MIDRARYLFGVFHVVLLPVGLLYWFAIHSWSTKWRRLGPARTWSIVLPVLAIISVLLYQFRVSLLGTDLGTSWSLIGIAVVVYVASTRLEVLLWRQLSASTLIGVPELSTRPTDPGVLLTCGAYAIVRHPRYLSAGIGVVANALFVNHAGLYALILVEYPVGLLMLALEERDLVARFGDTYREYQRDVPQLIPRFRRSP